MIVLPLAIVCALICAVATFASGATCQPGTHLRNATCTPCPRGSYSTRRNVDTCLLCPAGTFLHLRGARFAANCLPCRRDTFSRPGATKCKPCPAGSHSTSGSPCKTCPPGHVLKGMNKCVPCPRGLFNAGGGTCRVCPSSSEARNPGSSVCTPCARGTFRDLRNVGFVGNGRCRLCPPGSFASRRGATQCSRCPLGSETSAAGTACASCAAGTARGRVQQEKCEQCEPGTMSAGHRPAVCRTLGVACPAGTFEVDGACRACLPGQRMLRGRCLQCPAGSVSRGGDARLCSRCPAGKEPVGSMSFFHGAVCVCKRGSYQVKDGTCRSCRPGEYGTHSVGTNRFVGSLQRADEIPFAHCSYCPAGSVNPLFGARRCRMCGEGYFNAGGRLDQRTSCMKCPTGTRSPPQSPTFDGLFWRNGRRWCLSVQHNCHVGFVRRWFGCTLQFCLARNKMVLGSCGGCFGHEQVDEERGLCLPCGDGRENPSQHSRTWCTKCVANSSLFVFPYNYKSCRCYEGFGRKGAECRRCADGLVSVEERCVKCKEGVAKRGRFGVAVCGACEGEMVLAAGGKARCIPCAKGTRRLRDVLGVATDSCVPKD